MKRLILITFFLCCANYIFAQGDPSATDEEKEIWYKVDIQPQFPGGMGKFFNYVNTNLQYPKEAKKKGIEGKVYVEFIIDAMGNIMQDSTKVYESLCGPCDQEAVRLINESPKWIPGRVSELNKDVPVKMVMPIIFKR